MMVQWLEDNNVPFPKSMLKPELIIPKCTRTTRRVDVLLKAHGHTTLKRPPYHPNLNSIKMIWSIMKGHVAKHNVTFKINDVIDLCK